VHEKYPTAALARLTCLPTAGTRSSAAAASSWPTCDHGTWARARVRPGSAGLGPGKPIGEARHVGAAPQALLEGIEPAGRDRRGAVPDTRDRAGHRAIEMALPEQLSASS
jgi:hypothetical protein